MKTLSNLKLLTVSALIVLGMSSCLKTDDSLNVYGAYPYVLQNNYGEYIPQLRIQVSEPAKSASILVEGKSFKFTKLNDYYMEISEDDNFTQLDSITPGYYTVTATSVEGKTASLQVSLAASKTKKIGDIQVKGLKYQASTNQISIELADSVVNASEYYLMISTPLESYGYSMWIPYSKLTLSGDKKLSATVEDVDLQKDGKFRFAVAGTMGAVIRVDNDYLSVTGGQDASLEN